MELIWKIEDSDVQRIRSFYRQYDNSLFVRQRIDKNINGSGQDLTKEAFWKTMVACLLSTQQRSGPYSAVTRFLWIEPFPLDYTFCLRQEGLESFVEKTIAEFGGIRRAAKIGQAISENFKWLVRGGWNEVFAIVESLEEKKTAQTERQAARFIARKLKGFGPKQSRNLLQSLGLTRYEIPVDSRITKWLNDFGFPVKLTAAALSDENYYSFVLDGLQELCRLSNIYPCVLDAAIFASFDPEWPDIRLVW